MKRFLAILLGAGLVCCLGAVIQQGGTGGGSQTPWSADINGNQKSLTNASSATFGSLTVTGATVFSGTSNQMGGDLNVAGTLYSGGTAGFITLKTNAGGTSVLPANSIGIWGDVTANNIAATNLAGTKTYMAQTAASVSSQWLKSFASSGAFTQTQPVIADISSPGFIPTNGLSIAFTFSNTVSTVGTATNFADYLAVTNTLNARTNIGLFDITTNNLVAATRITNGTRRLFVTASVQLTAAAAGTAKAALYGEYAGLYTNKVSVSAGPLASLVTVEELALPVGPAAIYYILDETSGTGASISIVAGTCSVTGY